MQVMEEANIPNLFVIGAPKSGTTAVVKELNRHSEIFVPSTKEPRYFDAHVFYDSHSLYPIKKLNDYLSLYEEGDATQAKFRVDGSVFNMYSQSSIENILSLNPSSKFILILRDPVEATKSMFIQRLKYASGPMREISDDFPTCWRSLADRKVGEGYPKNCANRFLFRYDLLYSYEKYIPMLKDVIPEDQLLVLNYECLKHDSSLFYAAIYNFLSIKFEGPVVNSLANPSVAYKETTRDRLIKLIASITRPVRKKMGLLGFVSAKDLFPSRELDLEGLRLNEIDDEVALAFSKTYAYLTEIGLRESQK